MRPPLDIDQVGYQSLRANDVPGGILFIATVTTASGSGTSSIFVSCSAMQKDEYWREFKSSKGIR